MRTCWAKDLGDCAGKISGEHIISKAVLKADRIFIPDCKLAGSEKAVGVNSLTRRILCEHHNSALSPVDQAGGLIMSVLEDEDRQLDEVVIDGLMFERWLLKTAINSTFAGDDRIGVGMTGAEAGKVPAYLLHLAFGRVQFTHQMGAYFLFPEGTFWHRQGEIIVVPIIKNGEIGGVYFHLRGFDVFLSLFPGHHPSTLSELGLTSERIPEHALTAVPRYRPPSLVTTRASDPSRTVRFRWPADSR